MALRSLDDQVALLISWNRLAGRFAEAGREARSRLDTTGPARSGVEPTRGTRAAG